MNILRHYYNLFCFSLRGNKGYYAAREYLGRCLIEELDCYIDLKGKKVLDIGGEFGDFCKVLAEQRGCEAINLEPKKMEFHWKTVMGSVDRLPFKNGEFDVVLLRGVLQHIPTDKKLKSLKEMHRVLKDGGIAYIMIPPWWSPLSGQNIKPFQYLGFKLAKHFSNTIMGRKISANSLVELGLWPMTFRSTLKYIDKAGFKILKTTDILGRIHFLTKIPIVREILINSAGFILKKK